MPRKSTTSTEVKRRYNDKVYSVVRAELPKDTVAAFKEKCKETGEEKTILFGLTGTGYFDLVAYQKFNDGEMSDYIPTDEELQKSFDSLPKVDK